MLLHTNYLFVQSFSLKLPPSQLYFCQITIEGEKWFIFFPQTPVPIGGFSLSLSGRPNRATTGPWRNLCNTCGNTACGAPGRWLRPTGGVYRCLTRGYSITMRVPTSSMPRSRLTATRGRAMSRFTSMHPTGTATDTTMTGHMTR